MKDANSSEEYGTYLFEYPFDGSIWAFHLKAKRFDEAEARLKALPWASLKGLSMGQVPAYLGPLVKAECWFRNMLGLAKP